MLWPKRGRFPINSSTSPMIASITGASFNMSSVMPVNSTTLSVSGRFEFTRVTKRPVICPCSTFRAAISVIFSFFGSRPVVSKSRAMYESVISTYSFLLCQKFCDFTFSCLIYFFCFFENCRHFTGGTPLF